MSGPRRAPTWARPDGVFESLIDCGPSIFSTNWSHQNMFIFFHQMPVVHGEGGLASISKGLPPPTCTLPVIREFCVEGACDALDPFWNWDPFRFCPAILSNALAHGKSSTFPVKMIFCLRLLLTPVTLNIQLVSSMASLDDLACCWAGRAARSPAGL